jgi:hypothetical protein
MPSSAGGEARGAGEYAPDDDLGFHALRGECGGHQEQQADPGH